MSTYYWTPNFYEETIKQLVVGDNIENVPYLSYYRFVELIRQYHSNVDFLYEGMNLIIFAL